MIQLVSDKRREQLRKASRKFLDKFPEKPKEYKKRFKELNPEKFKEQAAKENKAYRLKHPEKIKQRSIEWRTANAEHIKHTNSLRRQRLKCREAMWDEELTQLVTKEAHSLAKLREKLFGFKWHVDHVVPLCGVSVSGFHVWNNLQVIPATLNMKKHNLFEGDF